jgi:hypothetical protein
MVGSVRRIAGVVVRNGAIPQLSAAMGGQVSAR